jgi:hypothetical protein
MAVLRTAALVAFAAWFNARCFYRIISAREYPSQEGYSHPNFVDLLSGALRTKQPTALAAEPSLTSGDGVKVHRALGQEAQRYLASIASCGADGHSQSQAPARCRHSQAIRANSSIQPGMAAYSARGWMGRAGERHAESSLLIAISPSITSWTVPSPPTAQKGGARANSHPREAKHYRRKMNL